MTAMHLLSTKYGSDSSSLFHFTVWIYRETHSLATTGLDNYMTVNTAMTASKFSDKHGNDKDKKLLEDVVFDIISGYPLVL